MHLIFLFFCSSLVFANPPPQAPRPGVDFLGPLWLPRTYKITCCRGGSPTAENANLITNWTETVLDYAFDEKTETGENQHCRVYEGTFLLSATALFNYSFLGYGVQCKCPNSQIPLDRHCRQLPPCLNNGYRSQSVGGLCACTEPYFGEFCEKMCDQGQTLKGVDGRSYCSCLPFYQGERCTEMVCLNGGVNINGRCSCPPTYLGYHCEVDSNRTVNNARYNRYGETSEVFSRDVSGTVFSLVMIVVLVVSMYLLMKHRMQVQSRFSSSRREEFLRAAAMCGGVPTQGRAGLNGRFGPFIANGIEGPPPYIAPGSGSRSNEVLPPLPTYEDATKDLPLRPWMQPTNQNVEEVSSADEPSSSSSQSAEEVTTSSEESTNTSDETPVTEEGPADTRLDRKVSSRRSV
ncbi:unnamed protein product [Auanema sp. JU1783]|nr:unnamed protein product [Auanema sp. JU1783]